MPKDEYEWDHLPFIDHYLYHTQRYESPNSFWRWSAIGTIAAVLRDNVYRRMGDNKLYPNIYILALAESSFHRKGRPVEFSEGLVRDVKNVKVISGRASIQAILAEIGRAESDPQTGKVVKSGSAIFYAPEMAAGLVADPQAISILTDIYESKPVYDSLLKTQAKVAIKNLVFSMYSASNEALLKTFYDSSALNGGLLARTFLVIPDEFRPPNSLMDIEEDEYTRIQLSKRCLTGKLAKIASLNGEMKFSLEARNVYTTWYDPFRKNHENIKDSTGMMGRIHTSILKVAMILAAAEYSQTVEERHVTMAIEWSLSLIPNYARLAISSGKLPVKDVGGMLLNDLADCKTGKLSRKEIFQRHILDFDPVVFDTAIVALDTGGIIKQSLDPITTMQYFELTEKGKELLGKK